MTFSKFSNVDLNYQKNFEKKTSNIYLDYHATIPCDPQVLEAMMPYLTEYFGNPHSRNHSFGWTAEKAVENAREQIADFIGARSKEIVFTSGATESNNLALKGTAYFRRHHNPEKENGHIIVSTIEHKCILETTRALEQEGFKITYVDVDSEGFVSVKDIENAITPETFLISIGAVNGEIGTIQPLKEIGALCRERKIYFHTDGAQALGKIPLNVEEMNIDLMSLSSHKIYGPKGIGALYVRKRPRVRLRPLFHGGGQEGGLRSGTLGPFLCVGFGKACVLCKELMVSESQRLQLLVQNFYKNLQENLEYIILNGPKDMTRRVPGNLNISFFGVEGEGLMMGMSNIALSSGSACTSESLEPSYILKNIGIGDDLAHSSLRFSFGRYTTDEECQEVEKTLISAVQRLRSMSPLWDLYKEGIDLSTIQWIAH